MLACCDTAASRYICCHQELAIRYIDSTKKMAKVMCHKRSIQRQHFGANDERALNNTPLACFTKCKATYKHAPDWRTKIENSEEH